MTRACVVYVVTLACLGVGAAAHANEEPPSTPPIAERYDAGKRALFEGRFDDARADFEAALELVEDEVMRWQVLLGLALAHEHLGETTRAIDLYRHFLARSDGSPRAASDKWRVRIGEARVSIARLEGEVLQTRGRLALEVAPDLAPRVRVRLEHQGAVRAVSAPAVLFLEPGPWLVRAEALGMEPLVEAGTIAAGDRKRVAIELTAIVERPSPVMPVAPIARDDDTLAIVALGVGAALLISGAVMTGLAVSDVDELDALVAEPGTPENLARYREVRARGKTRETVSWVLYGTGAAALGAGILGLALDRGTADAEVIGPGPRVTWALRF